MAEKAMEEPPKGKATVFYDVLRSIDNNQWLEFARGEKYLNLLRSDVDDIQHNYKNNVEEQKYQMLLSWGHSFGDDDETAIASLLKLQKDFFNRPTLYSSSDNLQKEDFTEHPTSKDMALRSLLMEVGRKLTSENLKNLQKLYSPTSAGQKHFSEAEDMLLYIEDNHSWGANFVEVEEKLNLLKFNLNAIERKDLLPLIEERSKHDLLVKNNHQLSAVPEKVDGQSLDGKNLDSSNCGNQKDDTDSSASLTAESDSLPLQSHAELHQKLSSNSSLDPNQKLGSDPELSLSGKSSLTSPEWKEYLSKRQGCRGVEALIHEWKMHMDQKDIKKATAAIAAISEIAVDCEVAEKDKICDHCYGAFVFITDCCLKNNMYCEARLMALCRLTILRECTRKNLCEISIKLEGLGLCFVSLAYFQFGLEDHCEVSKICVFIDKVLELMYDLGDFEGLEKHEIVKKNQYIFAVLLKYGALCVTIENYQNSLAVYSQAMTMLRTLFGSSAKTFKVFVECSYNIALSHTNLKQYHHAKNALEKAVNACKCVTNWSVTELDAERQRYVSICESLMTVLETSDSPQS